MLNKTAQGVSIACNADDLSSSYGKGSPYRISYCRSVWMSHCSIVSKGRKLRSWNRHCQLYEGL